MTESFYSLTPHCILDSVEEVLNLKTGSHRPTGRCFTLNSLENRVYEIELEDAPAIIAKFYRPKRWTQDAILEEHAFLQELAEHEIPAVAPLILPKSSLAPTLSQTIDGIFFAVFPKVRGRILQELSADQLMQIGRYLGRLHRIGQKYTFSHRPALTTAQFIKAAIKSIEQCSTIPNQIKNIYIQQVNAILFDLAQQIDSLPRSRIHGDCHLGNLLWQGGYNEATAVSILDFDDMVMGPAAQDIWMVVRGNDEAAMRDRETLLIGYEQMHPFDHAQLNAIEALRRLRMIHYLGWIARRWQDPIFQHTFPQFTTQEFWNEEILALQY